jgi:hypothetical protein
MAGGRLQVVDGGRSLVRDSEPRGLPVARKWPGHCLVIREHAQPRTVQPKAAGPGDVASFPHRRGRGAGSSGNASRRWTRLRGGGTIDRWVRRSDRMDHGVRGGNNPRHGAGLLDAHCLRLTPRTARDSGARIPAQTPRQLTPGLRAPADGAPGALGGWEGAIRLRAWFLQGDQRGHGDLRAHPPGPRATPLPDSATR